MHYGNKWSRSIRQAKIDSGAVNVSLHERDIVTHRSHSRGKSLTKFLFSDVAAIGNIVEDVHSVLHLYIQSNMLNRCKAQFRLLCFTFSFLLILKFSKRCPDLHLCFNCGRQADLPWRIFIYS